MTTLYTLSHVYREAIKNVQALVVHNYSNPTNMIGKDAMEDLMEEAGEDLREKCINVGLHIKNLRSDLRQLEEVVKEYQAKAKKIEDNLAFYENYLHVHMTKSGFDDVSNDYVRMMYKKLPDKVACEIAPNEFSITVPESVKPDKKKIKDFLENRGTLPFAKMITDRTKLVIK